MADNALAGYETVATFTPDQLYAGEADIVTTQGTVAKGVNAVRYQVMSEVGGVLRPYDPAGRATGSVTFSGTGTANDTITINGKAITLVGAAPAGDQVLIGGSATATAANLATFLNANADRFGVTATAAAGVVTLRATDEGIDGNDVTLAENGTNTTVSAANLAGGNETSLPACVLPHAVNATAADTDTPMIVGGVLNFDVLVAGSADYATLREAFRRGNSNIVIQKLY